MKNESAVVSKQCFKLPFPLSQSAGKTAQVGTTIIIIIIILIIIIIIIMTNVLDKMNKKCYIIEGTVCVPGTIPARKKFKLNLGFVNTPRFDATLRNKG